MRSLIVVPTYNEADNIEALAEALLGEGDFDLLIVDDNSPDGTGRVAEALAQRYAPRVSVLHRPLKMGLGTAYIAGFKHALDNSYEVVYQMDADFSHSPQDLARLHEAMTKSAADLVLGSRYVAGGGTRNWSRSRELLSRAGSFYARTVLGINVADLTGGFKGFRRKALECLDLHSIHSSGYSFQIETTYRCLLAGCKVVEVPIVFEERRKGKSKMSRAIVLEAMLVVWQLRLETLMGQIEQAIRQLFGMLSNSKAAR